MSCLFCKIISKEEISRTIYEDDHTMAFLNLYPANLGHTLVIPKIHSDDLLKTDIETVTKVYQTIKKITPAILSGVNSSAFNCSINNGAISGQVIFHFHVHIIPRFSNDNLQMWPKTAVTSEALDQTYNNIKKYL